MTEDAPLTWPTGDLVDLESIEGYTEDARKVAHPLDDSEIRTPDWVIEQLESVSRWASRMVLVIENAEILKRLAAADLADAKAQAVIDAAAFPAREQASRVVLATRDARRKYDASVVAFEKARRVGNLLTSYTGRLQSIAKQIEITFGGVGRRGGA